MYARVAGLARRSMPARGRSRNADSPRRTAHYTHRDAGGAASHRRRQGERINLISFLPTTTHALLCCPGQVANIPFGGAAVRVLLLVHRSSSARLAARPPVLYGKSRGGSSGSMQLSVCVLPTTPPLVYRALSKFRPDFPAHCETPAERREHASSVCSCVHLRPRTYTLYRRS